MPMLRRSQSAAGVALLLNDRESRRIFSITAKPKLRAVILNQPEAIQAQAVANLFLTKYGYPARDKQIQTVINILNGHTAFLLAGTGFGKSRVPEMLFMCYEEHYAPIIMCINPLDALGDDQVTQKRMVGLNAINLTAEQCTQAACDGILAGKTPFVYVSPEVALTSPIFDKMWCDTRFQTRLVLSVVDEAHMVYTWGLVESGVAKKMASHTRVQDAGVFRPSYGDLARRFLSTVKVPLLLMSATCTPQALHAIMCNLKLDPQTVRFTRAELTRPELRLIRRTFKRPIKASLRGIFAHHAQVPTVAIPPTLVYSGTQNSTLEYLTIINTCRGHPNETGNPRAACARRYHACTGPETKLEAVAAYVAGSLVVLCCTLALGLGQNWHQVRRVVVIGRQDPCNYIQMSGRCGRDGRRGLGLLLVENNRTNGKNTIADFTNPHAMSDDDRMDALAITPVCLRIALAVDLQEGYIPLHADHWSVREEAQRQQAAQMAPCDCSNCKPEDAEALWLAQSALTTENFDKALEMDSAALQTLVRNLPNPPPVPECEPLPVALVCGPDDDILTSNVLETLVARWDVAFIELFLKYYTKHSDLGPRDFFGKDLAWQLAKNIDLYTKPADFAIVLASEAIPGQFRCLHEVFRQWQLDFNTVDTLKAAVDRRLATQQPQVAQKPPQSVEGALLSKNLAEAQKKAVQTERELIRLQEAQAKLHERERKEQAKADAEAARELAKSLAAQARLDERAVRDQQKAEALAAREMAKLQAVQAKELERVQREQAKAEALAARAIAKRQAAQAKEDERVLRLNRKQEEAACKNADQKHAGGESNVCRATLRSSKRGPEESNEDYAGSKRRA